MRTEDLIKALAEDHALRPQPGSLRLTFFVAMALGLTIAAIAFALVLGVRPDIALAMQTWRFDFKLVMTATLAIASAWLVWRLSRPAVDARPAEADPGSFARAVARRSRLRALVCPAIRLVAARPRLEFSRLRPQHKPPLARPSRRRILCASPRRAVKAGFRGRSRGAARQRACRHALCASLPG